MSNTEWFKKVFLRKIAKGRPKSWGYWPYIYALFNPDVRLIDNLRCIKPIRLRGDCWVDSKPIPGLVNKKVLNIKMNDVITIRDDSRESFITIENKFGCANIDRGNWLREYKKHFDSVRLGDDEPKRRQRSSA